MYVDFHTKKPFVFSDFNETCKVLKYETDEISSSRSRVVACGLRDERADGQAGRQTDRQTDRQSVMTKQIVPVEILRTRLKKEIAACYN